MAAVNPSPFPFRAHQTWSLVCEAQAQLLKAIIDVDRLPPAGNRRGAFTYTTIRECWYHIHAPEKSRMCDRVHSASGLLLLSCVTFDCSCWMTCQQIVPKSRSELVLFRSWHPLTTSERFACQCQFFKEIISFVNTNKELNHFPWTWKSRKGYKVQYLAP